MMDIAEQLRDPALDHDCLHGMVAANEIESNRVAIAELVGALIEARAQVAEICDVFRIPMPFDSMTRYDAAITKYDTPTTTTTKEQA